MTGGAGYIGAHVVRSLLTAGERVVALDDLSTGVRARLPEGVVCVEASVHDLPALTNALGEYSIDGVIHLAAKKAVAESVAEPIRYYRENIGGITTLLEAMADMGVTCLVYSSSAAVYGEPPWSPISEDTPAAPKSPYGETKLIGEWAIRAAAAISELSWVSLRYFNVAGASEPGLADTSANNLIPMVYAALDSGENPEVFGTDYPTPDGSCIRDYVHVADLAEAHVRAAQYTRQAQRGDVFNVGTGTGASVWEVMAAISEQIGRDVDAVASPRRAGDPPELVASVDRIAGVLGWQATRTLADMVRR
ncbi:MAG: UDP-glucose 4-epimerase GalE [Candidatus Nanopelagicales bacterium]